jgi:signal transduction histidine kinase
MMPIPLARISALHLPRRSVRMQIALLYGGLFLASAMALLALTYLFVHSSSGRAPGSPSSNLGANPVRSDVLAFAFGSAVALTIMGVFSFGLGWLVAGRLLRPLRTITATAQEISATNLHQRLSLRGADDELTELGRTLDDLFGRLEASFESQRHFVANASHELRTPLAGQKTLLQVAVADPDATAEDLRAACEEVIRLGDQQERLIDSLLTLATSERGVELWEPFDLGAVTDSVLLDRRQETQRRGIRINASIVTTPAIGDPGLVERLVANLVDNALRHNVAGGRVDISTVSAPGRATLSVSNTGPVVVASVVDRLFLPFQQAGSERVGGSDGHGLGLTIVRAIAEAHEATVTAAARSEGGMEISVTFRVPTTN